MRETNNEADDRLVWFTGHHRAFLAIHIPAAMVGLVGTALHWIWIYI